MNMSQQRISDMGGSPNCGISTCMIFLTIQVPVQLCQHPKGMFEAMELIDISCPEAARKSISTVMAHLRALDQFLVQISSEQTPKTPTEELQLPEKILPCCVDLEVQCSCTAPGDTVVVVGSCPELGNWKADRGLPLRTSQELYPKWIGAVNIESCAARDVQFKLAILRPCGPDWEQTENRNLTVQTVPWFLIQDIGFDKALIDEDRIEQALLHAFEKSQADLVRYAVENKIDIAERGSTALAVLLKGNKEDGRKTRKSKRREDEAYAAYLEALIDEAIGDVWFPEDQKIKDDVRRRGWTVATYLQGYEQHVWTGSRAISELGAITAGGPRGLGDVKRRRALTAARGSRS
eukprot:symbB.v1.2.014293.t1/scaffold1034.1/size142864/6